MLTNLRGSRHRAAAALVLTAGIAWLAPSCSGDSDTEPFPTTTSAGSGVGTGSGTGGASSTGVGPAGGSGGVGTGGGTSGECDTADQCPGEDTTCRYRICQNHVCAFEDAPPGTECSENAGTVCDGLGTCIGCGSDPNPPGGTCPDVCTLGCTNGRCSIDCTDNSGCASETIDCPAGFICRVQCGGSSSCVDATVNCPELYGCDVTCTTNSACDGLTVECSTGTCDLYCTGGGACDDTTVLNCGSQACEGDCEGSNAATVNCGDSCECTDGC